MIIVCNPGDDMVAKIESASPGDTVLFKSGVHSYAQGLTYSEKYIDVSGTENAPILIKSEIPRGAIIDGTGSDAAIRFRDASWVVLDGFTITNPDPDGRDGRVAIESTDAIRQGAHLYGECSNFTVRNNFFYNVGTRGILVGAEEGTDPENVIIENNLFSHIGYCTAGGDINVTAGKNTVIKNNLFGGSIDGVVFGGGTPGGHAVCDNVFLPAKAEDAIDFKGVNFDGTGPWSVIQGNVVLAEGNGYSGITVQNESNKVAVFGNYLYANDNTAPAKLIHVHGRSNNTYVGDGVKDIWIAHNALFNADVGVRVNQADDLGPTHLPVDIVNVVIDKNTFIGVTTATELCCSVAMTDGVEQAANADLFQEAKSVEAAILANLFSVFTQAEVDYAIQNSRATIQDIECLLTDGTKAQAVFSNKSFFGHVTVSG